MRLQTWINGQSEKNYRAPVTVSDNEQVEGVSSRVLTSATPRTQYAKGRTECELYTESADAAGEAHGYDAGEIEGEGEVQGLGESEEVEV